MILTRFQSCGIVISYADIARVARQEDRRTLAAQLLEHEVLVEDQVQMLLEMDEADKALDKATSSWDAQLGNYCHYSIRKNKIMSGGFMWTRSKYFICLDHLHFVKGLI